MAVGWRKTPGDEGLRKREAVVTAVEEVEAAEAGVAVVQEKAVAVGKVAVVAEEREVAAAGRVAPLVATSMEGVKARVADMEGEEAGTGKREGSPATVVG
eukprot:gene1229-1806_t